jgi:hypothetical protein
MDRAFSVYLIHSNNRQTKFSKKHKMKALALMQDSFHIELWTSLGSKTNTNLKMVDLRALQIKPLQVETTFTQKNVIFPFERKAYY